MKRKVREAGNSLVIGITPMAKELLKLELGSVVDVTVKGKSIIITKAKEDKPNG